MVDESGFRQVIVFLAKLGVYDVILPFLLVFTIVFAILDKTKALGTENINGKEVTKKNINAIVAFVIAFLVIASTKLVAVISEVMANVVLLLILAVSFLLLVGVFMGSKEVTLEKFPGWTKFFMIFMFIGIVVIFLNALDWLKYLAAIFVLPAEWVAAILFIVVILGFMWYVTKDQKPPKEKSD